ncbi:MAG: hypothetical protein ACJAWP_001665 [Porticoccus sp.]|jgi:hypothetical protein
MYVDQFFWHFNQGKKPVQIVTITPIYTSRRLQSGMDRRSRDYRSMLSGMPADNEKQCALTAT